MGCLANDVASIEVPLLWFHRLSVYQRKSWYDNYNGTDRYMARYMECVTFVIDMSDERIYIAWLDMERIWYYFKAIR